MFQTFIFKKKDLDFLLLGFALVLFSFGFSIVLLFVYSPVLMSYPEQAALLDGGRLWCPRASYLPFQNLFLPNSNLYGVG